MLCAFPLAHVVEIMRALPTRALANAPEFVRGISIIRGEPLPVVDLALVLGAVSAGELTRFVVVRSGDRKVAVAVETVVGIRQAASEMLAGMPRLLSKAQPGIVTAIGALERELLLVLEATYFVPEVVWSSLADEEVA